MARNRPVAKQPRKTRFDRRFWSIVLVSTIMGLARHFARFAPDTLKLGASILFVVSFALLGFTALVRRARERRQDRATAWRTFVQQRIIR